MTRAVVFLFTLCLLLKNAMAKFAASGMHVDGKVVSEMVEKELAGNQIACRNWAHGIDEWEFSPCGLSEADLYLYQRSRAFPHPAPSPALSMNAAPTQERPTGRSGGQLVAAVGLKLGCLITSNLTGTEFSSGPR